MSDAIKSTAEEKKSAIPTTMKAVGFSKFGGPEVLEVVTVPTPKPGARDLLIHVRACSANPTDMKQRSNWNKSSSGISMKIVGYDGAGVVVAVGSAVTHFKQGDQVFFAGSVNRDGCYAEYVLIDERIAAFKPKSFSWEQAAAEPLTALTAYEALIEMMGMSMEDPKGGKSTLLIVAGAGGVGSVGIQIAKKLLNVRVIATASRDDTIKYCKEMGADDIIDHRKPLTDEINRLGLKGVNYVLNCSTTTTERMAEFFSILLPFGKLCIVAGNNVPVQVEISPIMTKRLSIVGEYMYGRPLYDIEPERQNAWLTKHAAFLESGVLKSRLLKQFSLWDLDNGIRAIHREFEKGIGMGKVSFTVSTDAVESVEKAETVLAPIKKQKTDSK